MKCRSIKQTKNPVPKSSICAQTTVPVQIGLRKIIKDSGNLTTGRCKKVQFNTLPELSQSKNRNMFDEKDSNCSRNIVQSIPNDVFTKKYKNEASLKYGK